LDSRAFWISHYFQQKLNTSDSRTHRHRISSNLYHIRPERSARCSPAQISLEAAVAAVIKQMASAKNAGYAPSSPLSNSRSDSTYRCTIFEDQVNTNQSSQHLDNQPTSESSQLTASVQRHPDPLMPLTSLHRGEATSRRGDVCPRHFNISDLPTSCHWHFRH
jgi:hypothetical protein